MTTGPYEPAGAAIDHGFVPTAFSRPPHGAIAGPPALKTLAGLLQPRGLLKLTQSSDLRACAAIALGKIGTPEARQVLASAADDKDLVVRNAVNRALRESAA